MSSDNIAVTITALDIENVKRVKAVRLDPAETGLTIIGGENRQGKTSVLEAIMGALGGDSYKQGVHEGAEKGVVKIALSNGVEVTRTYTAAGGSRLQVTDPSGMKGGQQLLNAFVSDFALDVGTFMGATDKKKAEILLKVIGVNPQPFEERIRALEGDRLLKGRERDRAKGHAESLVFHEDIGTEKLDGNAVNAQMTEALAHNARIRQAGTDVQAATDRVDLANMRLQHAQEALRKAQEGVAAATQAVDDAQTKLRDVQEHAATVGQPVDTQAITAKLQDITAYNEKVSENLARQNALDFWGQLADEYKAISAEIEGVREELRALLEGAVLPYPGLMVEDGELAYHGKRWATLSESERLILATAVSRAVLPSCGFVLIDGLERMDRPTLRTFAAWLSTQGLQAIGTRVGDDGESTIIIEDGMIGGMGVPPVATVDDEPSFM